LEEECDLSDSTICQQYNEAMAELQSMIRGATAADEVLSSTDKLVQENQRLVQENIRLKAELAQLRKN